MSYLIEVDEDWKTRMAVVESVLRGKKEVSR